MNTVDCKIITTFISEEKLPNEPDSNPEDEFNVTNAGVGFVIMLNIGWLNM